MDENNLKWLYNWYNKNCNGFWEHHYGIKIETIDNPGRAITIDTESSTEELKNMSWKIFEKAPTDWYGYKVEEKKFEASGDPSKLEFLINLFKNTIESEE